MFGHVCVGQGHEASRTRAAMIVRSASLRRILLYAFASSISYLPMVKSQRLAGVSGEDCIDQAYDGLQKFWCAQNECKVNLCRYVLW